MPQKYVKVCNPRMFATLVAVGLLLSVIWIYARSSDGFPPSSPVAEKHVTVGLPTLANTASKTSPSTVNNLVTNAEPLLGDNYVIIPSDDRLEILRHYDENLRKAFGGNLVIAEALFDALYRCGKDKSYFNNLAQSDPSEYSDIVKYDPYVNVCVSLPQSKLMRNEEIGQYLLAQDDPEAQLAVYKTKVYGAVEFDITNQTLILNDGDEESQALIQPNVKSALLNLGLNGHCEARVDVADIRASVEEPELKVGASHYGCKVL